MARIRSTTLTHARYGDKDTISALTIDPAQDKDTAIRSITMTTFDQGYISKLMKFVITY